MSGNIDPYTTQRRQRHEGQRGSTTSPSTPTTDRRLTQSQQGLLMPEQNRPQHRLHPGLPTFPTQRGTRNHQPTPPAVAPIHPPPPTPTASRHPQPPQPPINAPPPLLWVASCAHCIVPSYSSIRACHGYNDLLSLATMSTLFLFRHGRGCGPGRSSLLCMRTSAETLI